MVLAEIGTAGVISAYFFSRHITSGFSLNVPDPIEGQPVQLSYYLCVFGCGLIFWLLVLLRAKLHEVAKLAKLITSITILNLCGCLLAPFMKLPLLVRFLVLFQASSNLALLIIWAFLSLKECMILPDAHTQQQQKSSPEPQAVHKPHDFHALSGHRPRSRLRERDDLSNLPPQTRKMIPCTITSIALNVISEKLFLLSKGIGKSDATLRSSHFELTGKGGKVDEAGGSGSGHGSGASGREENRSRYGGNDGEGGAGGGGDRGASGSGHGSGTSGSGENSGGYEGHGQDEGGTGRGGREGGDRGRDGGGGGGNLEGGGRGTNKEQAFKSSKITEMSLMLTAQTTAALIGFHLTTPSSSSKALLVVVLIDQLVAYLCGLTSILLSSNKPEDSKAAKIFADIGFVCTALGFILMVAMFVPWYLVLIAVLLFGVIWLIFFRNGLKTCATEVWSYLKNST